MIAVMILLRVAAKKNDEAEWLRLATEYNEHVDAGGAMVMVHQLGTAKPNFVHAVATHNIGAIFVEFSRMISINNVVVLC